MSFTIKDLQNLTNSKEFAEYKDKYQRYIILWEKIYARRKDLWLTQSKLWELSWIPQNKISELESWTYWEAWIEMIVKLSKALNISFEYLFYENITRKTVELYNYILSKLENVPDIMQFMKLPYFIDLELIKNNFKQATNFEYIRWNYWPFDKKVYVYQSLFSFNIKFPSELIPFCRFWEHFQYGHCIINFAILLMVLPKNQDKNSKSHNITNSRYPSV